MLVLLTERIFFLNKLGPVSGLEKGYIDFFVKKEVPIISFSPWAASPEDIINNYPVTHIILTGGNDVSPEIYQETALRQSGYSAERDAFEMALLKTAFEQKLPVLGICRGMQLMNVYWGGKLIQDLEEHFEKGVHPPAVNHPAAIVDTRLSAELHQNEVSVNSFHNQAVITDNLSAQLKASVLAKNNIVECLYHPGLPMAGIQWHPERKGAPDGIDDLLIDSFLNHKLYWK